MQGFYTTDIFYGHGIYHNKKSLNIAISRSLSLLQLRLVSNLNFENSEQHAYALQPQVGMGVPGLFEFYMGYNFGVREVGEVKYQNGMSFTFRLYLLPGAQAIGANMKETFRKGALQEYYFEVAKPPR